jgi:hypothetical protein
MQGKASEYMYHVNTGQWRRKYSLIPPLEASSLQLHIKAGLEASCCQFMRYPTCISAHQCQLMRYPPGVHRVFETNARCQPTNACHLSTNSMRDISQAMRTVVSQRMRDVSRPMHDDQCAPLADQHARRQATNTTSSANAGRQPTNAHSLPIATGRQSTDARLLR